MAKKTSFALKQLIPEENPKTGTKYIVRKPTKGLKVAEKLRLKKYDPVLKKHVWFVEKKCHHIVNKINLLVFSYFNLINFYEQRKVSRYRFGYSWTKC